MLKPADRAQLHPVDCHDLKRLGPLHDGGYVVPLDAVKRTKHLISFGMARDWKFEADFLRHNPTVFIHCYDHTISGGGIARYSLGHFLQMLYSPSKQSWERASKYFSYRAFFRGRIHHHRSRVWYSHEGESVTIRDVVGEAARGEIFLKIDFPGAEYRILDAFAEFWDRVDAMVIQFHDIDIMAEQFNAGIAAIRKHFHIVHVHGNNSGGVSPAGFPNLLEVTFLNRRLVHGEPMRSLKSYPVHGLDHSNDPDRPDLTLHFRV